jgi:hypothetical protein
MPTGSDDLLTQDQWAAGPTVGALKQANDLTYAALVNHLWSLVSSPAGGREKINASFIPPFMSHTTSTYTTFDTNTASAYDWQGRECSAPLHLTSSSRLSWAGNP